MKNTVQLEIDKCTKRSGRCVTEVLPALLFSFLCAKHCIGDPFRNSVLCQRLALTCEGEASRHMNPFCILFLFSRLVTAVSPEARLNRARWRRISWRPLGNQGRWCHAPLVCMGSLYVCITCISSIQVPLYPTLCFCVSVCVCGFHTGYFIRCLPALVGFDVGWLWLLLRSELLHQRKLDKKKMGLV